MIRSISVTFIATPAAANDIATEQIIANSKGQPATPAQLYGMVMKRLEAGVCVFVYVTKDGAYRTAIGTLSPVHLPPTKTKQASPDGAPTQTYYDFERAAYREFTKANVAAIISL
jgi:hypothetical protein